MDKAMGFFEEFKKLCNEKGVSFPNQSIIFSIDKQDVFKLICNKDNLFLESLIVFDNKINQELLIDLEKYIKVEIVEKPIVRKQGKFIQCYQQAYKNLDTFIQELLQANCRSIYLYNLMTLEEYVKYETNITNFPVKIGSHNSLFVSWRIK